MRKLVIVASALLSAVAGPANAGVVLGAITGGNVFGTGAFQFITAPAAVGFDNFNDNNLRAFNEVQNLTLASALSVDSGASGVTLAAGAVISSHLIAFDPPGTQRDVFQPSVAGYVEFDAPILGVIWRGTTLTATRALLGAAGTNYLTPAGFGLEQGADFFTIAPAGNARRLAVNFFSATSPGDTLRVITGRRATVSAVPEPATWLSMLFGLAVAGSTLRRRRTGAAHLA